VRAYVLMDVHAGEERSVQQMLKGVPGVIKVETTFGPYDAIAHIEASDLAGLGKLVYQTIRATPGVLDTITCLAVE
jgi:DNA-binding Lrp family transcriptional regulator